MKLVYVAGPYRGPNAWVIEYHIRCAEALALKVWQLGAACICPHANTRFFQGAAPDEVWLAGDVEIMRRCDAVLMTQKWQASAGALAEHNEAHRRGIPIFYELGDLEKWLKCENLKAAPRGPATMES